MSLRELQTLHIEIALQYDKNNNITLVNIFIQANSMKKIFDLREGKLLNQISNY